MAGRIESALARWLGEGRNAIGEIRIAPREDSGFVLMHSRDDDETAQDRFTKPEDALEIARYDPGGKFRPLKTAPNLRRGWRLELPDLASLHRALDYFYPAMLGSFLASEEGRLRCVPLRETLQRQTGMYAVTKQLTDGDADALVAETCNSEHGCLKTILWQGASLPPEKRDLARDQTGLARRVIPLPCAEGCNLLVAGARKIVKSRR